MPMVTMIQVLPRLRVEPWTGPSVVHTHTFHLMEQFSPINMWLTEMDSDPHWTLQIHWVRIKYGANLKSIGAKVLVLICRV